MVSTVTSRAPGKIIFLGEYAVLKGAPAIVAAMNRFATVRVTPSQQGFSLYSPLIHPGKLTFSLDDKKQPQFLSLSPEVLTKLLFFSTTFEFAVRELSRRQLPLHPAEIELDTSDFYLGKDDLKLGLGSSAALTVALLAALYEYAGISLRDEEARLHLLQMALDAHRVAQKKIGSGVDIAASTFGGVLEFQRMEETLTQPVYLEEVELPPNLYYLFVWSGTPASTSRLVKQVEEWETLHPKQAQELYRKMIDLCKTGCEAIKIGDTNQFLEIVDSYYHYLHELGKQSGAPIVSPVHQHLADLVKEAGGFYKPSGAGEGDLGIAFTNSPETAENIKRHLTSAGFTVLPLEIEKDGVQCQIKEGH